MGMVGNFGSRITFQTSDQRILTFSGMTQKVSGKYAKHSIQGQRIGRNLPDRGIGV